MGFVQYPDNIATSIYVDDEIQLSDIDSVINTQLRYFGLQIFKYGLNTNVNMYIKAYKVSDDSLIGTSDMIKVSEIPTETDYFYGWIYFRFAKRLSMTGATAVRFKLFLENYTFSEDSWIGAVYDWPTQMGYNSSSDQIQDAPFSIDLIGAN
jgi:hypothetical protein